MTSRRLGAVAIVIASICCSNATWAQREPRPMREAPPRPEVAPAAPDGDHEGAPPSQPEAEAKETVKESPDPGIIAPTMRGASGLFRTVSTDIGDQHTFRIGVHSEIFAASQFLVCTRSQGGECVAGDDNSRFAGTLALSYTPWRYLELFANFRSQANSNERDDANRIDQDVILALGDFGFGAKGQIPVVKGWGIGANFELDFLNSVGGVSVDGDAASFYIGAITTLDLDPLAGAPLRFHFNAGYQLDNSGSLASFDNYPLASLQVEKFALGINPSRMQLKLGMDFDFRRWTGFGLTPLMEFNFDIATGDTDRDFDDPRFLRPNGPLSAEDIDGRATIWMTLGARVNPLRGLNLDIGTDIGLMSPGYGFGPPVIPWNLILGLSYAVDPSPPTRVVTKERVKVVGSQAPPTGKLRGRITNARTLEPVEGAVITFPGRDLTGLSSDPDGGFISYDFPSGTLVLMVRHADYQPQKVEAEIRVGSTTQVEVKLEPAAPKIGRIDGKIVDLKGNGVAATIQAEGPETRPVSVQADGTFSVELKPGAYTLKVSAVDYLSKEHRVDLAAGATAAVHLTLSPKPRRSLVQVTRRAIRIRRQVHFATGTATIMPDSRQLLDEIVDVLVRNPQIRKVEIGGHTDNRGGADKNQQLSQDRAAAVRDYLVRNGVDDARLEAMGYGASRPLVPNLTARNRARNRRVEFKILEQ